MFWRSAKQAPACSPQRFFRSSTHTGNSGTNSGRCPLDFSRAELLDLYKIALEEYRFEVKLNMERMIHYVVFNTALLSAATGLLKLAGDPILDIFVALLFLIGVFTAWLGRRAVKRGHEYYRRTIYKKTLIEDLLGLHQPSKTIPAPVSLSPPLIGKPPSKTSIVHGAVVILW